MERRLKPSIGTVKSYRRGTHRIRSPRETYEAFAPVMERLGITRVANITGLDVIGIPVFTAVRPNAARLSTAQGKGLDADTARTGALMETVEWWHAENLCRPLRWGSYAALRDELEPLDPFCLPTVDGRPAHDRAQLWVEGRDLLRERDVWVPFDLVSFVAPHTPYRRQFWNSTNGLASGNHIIEAQVHALCEVIERDAAAYWERRSPVVGVLPGERKLDLSTVDDPSCRALLDRIAAAGTQVVAWDITTDIGVSAFCCMLLEDPDQRSTRVIPNYSGHGCHLSPPVALTRAITEAAQVRVATISGSRDTLSRAEFAEQRDDNARLMQWLLAMAEPGELAFSQPDLATDTLQADLDRILGALRSVGVNIAVAVDLTHAGIGIPVVRVVVPELEAPWLPGWTRTRP
jgi:ribosomal protein S12 methylthiotransferase accessory factor